MQLDRQIEAAERELRIRRDVYPRWVLANKMSESKASYQIAAMEAILQTLQRVARAQTDRLDIAGRGGVE